MKREDAIERLLGTIEDWDLDTLINYVREKEYDAFQEMEDTELEAIFRREFNENVTIED